MLNQKHHAEIRNRKFVSCWTVRLLIVLVLLIFPGSIEAQVKTDESISWVGPDRTLLHFQTHAEVEDFLLTAKIKSAKVLKSGITCPIKVTLEADGVRMKAIFRHVNVFKQEWNRSKGLKLNYHDSCVFELAAYRLSRMLGMDSIPPTVIRNLQTEDFTDASLKRKFPRLSGTLQAWVEDAMTENHRQEGNLNPPSGRYWAYQLQMMMLFDNLIFNDDRNQGNVLIGPDWKIWFIDSTRAFRVCRGLPNPDTVRMCDRNVWKRLVRLTNSEISLAMDGLLSGYELKTLLIRRQRLIDHLSKLIDDKGQDQVFFDLHQANPKFRAPIQMVSFISL